MNLRLIMTGMQALSSISSYGADKDQSKAQRVWQQYSNTMTDLSDAMMQNAITQNEVMALEASTDLGMDIQTDSLEAEGMAEVAAAAAGVKGRTVRQAKLDISRSASIAEGRRTRSLANQFLSFDQQRRTSRMTAAMKKNYSYIPKPRLSSYIMDAGVKALPLFMDKQATGTTKTTTKSHGDIIWK